MDILIKGAEIIGKFFISKFKEEHLHFQWRHQGNFEMTIIKPIK
jgi:hypothetical protein